MEDFKSELFGRRSPRQLNTFSNLFIVAVHYHTHQCIAASVACPMYTMQSTTHIPTHALYCC